MDEMGWDGGVGCVWVMLGVRIARWKRAEVDPV